jgi:hypothetical protein
VAANFARAQRGLWKRYAQVKTLRGLAGGFRWAVAKAGLRTPDGTLGIWLRPSQRKSFQDIADNMPEGTWNSFATRVCGRESRRDSTRLRRQREEELAVLTSAEARRALKAAALS